MDASPRAPYTPHIGTDDMRPWTPATAAVASPPTAAAPAAGSPFAVPAWPLAMPSAPAARAPLPPHSYSYSQSQSPNANFGNAPAMLQHRGGVNVGDLSRSQATPAASGKFNNQPAAGEDDASIRPLRLLRELASWRVLLSLALMWACFSMLSVPWLLWRSPIPTSAPSPDPTVFCRSHNEPVYHGSVAATLPPWQSGCVPCPPRGRCGDDGVLRCDKGLMRVHQECVPATSLHERALGMKEAAIHALERHAGALECDDPALGAVPGVAGTDLNLRQLRELVLPPAGTLASMGSAGRAEVDAAWELVSDRWLNTEAAPLASWDRGNPTQRVLLLHTDSRKLPLYRAVYPAKSLGCRLRSQVESHPLVSLLLGLACTGLVCVLVLLYGWVQLTVQSIALQGRLLGILRSDFYFDYDGGGGGEGGVGGSGGGGAGSGVPLHQAHSLSALQAEHVAQCRASMLRRGAGRLRRELDDVLQRRVWARVARALRAHPHVEEAVRPLQYGSALSWKWVGPTSTAAERNAGPDIKQQQQQLQSPVAMHSPLAWSVQGHTSSSGEVGARGSRSHSLSHESMHSPMTPQLPASSAGGTINSSSQWAL